jgi:hypothetical protein
MTCRPLKRILFLFCLAFAFSAQAGISGNAHSRDSLNQDSIHRPYNAWGHYETWGIKGKILPFLVGNSGGINALIGFEYGFCKNHSIGIDLYFLAMESSNDMVFDTAGVRHDVGNDQYTIDKALFINYRYYLPLKHPWRNPARAYYFGCFGRYGQLRNIKDPLFNKNFVRSDEVHYSAGIVFGALGKFSHKKRLGLDLNIGIFYKEKDITDVTNRNGSIYTTVSRPDNFGFRIGLNLYLMYYRKESKA